MPRRSPPVLRVALVAAAIGVAARGGATTLPDWDVDEIVRRADVVARGRVTACKTLVDAGEMRTECSLLVDEALLGTPPAVLVVTQQGGSAGGIARGVRGVPRLAEGDHVVLATFVHEDGHRYIVGLALGLFSVDEQIVEELVDPELDAGTALDDDGGARDAAPSAPGAIGAPPPLPERANFALAQTLDVTLQSEDGTLRAPPGRVTTTLKEVRAAVARVRAEAEEAERNVEKGRGK